MDNNGITITIGAPDESGSEGKQIAKYGVGKTCRGKVVNFKPYGFFVETEDGGFGLVHGRNIKGWDWSLRFDKVFKHGTTVEVTVIDIEAETNRMSFSCEMPEGYADEPEEGEDGPEGESLPPQKSRQEIARQWADENADKSNAAHEWLKTELADGPLYGPLTNVLCERFGVPVPASRWIRLFPEFTCYSGNGDNPKDLPAVALSERAGEVTYWDRIKVRTENLIEFRDRREDDTAKYGKLAKRLDAKAAFPGAKWILDYMSMARGLERGNGIYGLSDTVERLAIPMLGQLGWDVTAGNAALVRGGASTFDIRIYGGTASSGNVSVAVRCADAVTAFDALRGTDSPATMAGRDVVEQVLGLYNQLGGDDPAATKVVWTNGSEWVVFTRDLLEECIGVLAEHRGTKLMDELDCRYFRCVTFPKDGTPFEWLTAFAALHDLIGKE